MVMNVTKNSQKMKSKTLLGTQKILWNEKKCYIVIIRKHFNLENSASYKEKYRNFLLFRLCKLPPEI